ncbi:MAG: hypothetical protein J1E98_11495 [Lachnospiraceae bacterium]|nr:hypothetical protein [Lachnospiraceae bacterium]
MERNKIRQLRADEIECRVSTVNEKGVTLLLYKEARVDQKILDEAFGIFGWQRSHQSIEGILYCTVSVYDKDTNTWIAKQDVGTTNFAEKEKSQASDSFKRACVNWGIGRELYTAPFIWIPADKVGISQKGDKFYCNDSFSVISIGYSEEREITELRIVNGKGKIVYELKAKGKGQKTLEDQEESQEGHLTRAQMDSLKAELERTGVTMDTVQDRYRIQRPDAMSESDYKKVMAALAKTKSANAA